MGKWMYKRFGMINCVILATVKRELASVSLTAPAQI